VAKQGDACIGQWEAMLSRVWREYGKASTMTLQGEVWLSRVMHEWVSGRRCKAG
jgi:hypothetical protein